MPTTETEPRASCRRPSARTARAVTRRRAAGLGCALAAALAVAAAGCAAGERPAGGESSEAPPAPDAAVEEPAVLRLAVFNIEELSTARLTDVDAEGRGRDPQARAAAEVVRRVRPDVLVLNEIDLDVAAPDDPAANARRFRDAYLADLDLPYAFAAPTNTGQLSGLDLDRDGTVAGPTDAGSRTHGGDSWGYGTYPGQYAMAVLSRLPLAAAEARTFQRFHWRELPGNHLPEAFYGPEVAAALRLSSKSHWDLPLELGGGRRLHLWISHPTPPAFDGREDRNGRRNFDEIGFWVRYLEGSDALVDDAGRRGGYTADEPFVIAGDLNADPGDPAVYDGTNAIGQLLGQPRIHDPGELLVSTGAGEHARRHRAERAAESGGASAGAAAADPERPHPERATAEFLGGRRVDYLLPSAGIEVAAGGVFWPAAADDPEGHRLAGQASDHRLVWLDLVLPGDG